MPWDEWWTWGKKLDRISAQLSRMEQILLRTEQEVLVAYEAELDAAEAAAKANSDVDDSVEQILVQVAALVAALKTGQTDPATAKRITDLAAAIKARSEQLGTAAANVPTS